MKQDFRILTAGGDMRMLSCAGRLSEDYITAVTGFDAEHIPESMKAEGRYDCLVLPVMPLDDSGDVSTPCFSGRLTSGELENMLTPDAMIFAGRVDERLMETFPGHDIIDYMLREELMLKNAIPTAEGAVQIALTELPVTLSGLKVLIVGLGRIGTALAGVLKGFGADITAAVRNAKGAARARILGIKPVCMKDIGTEYGLVFNTVPELVMGRSLLSRLDPDTLIIDLASKPGGIDFDSASELGMHVIWALGLPGKTAPVTAGEMIGETIAGILSERGDRCG